MLGIWVLVGGIAGLAGFAGAHQSRRSKRRKELRERPLSIEDHAIIERNFPLWEKVPEDIRQNAVAWMQVFLDEKSFEPCGDLEQVTREMRLSVVAPACLLIANRPQDYYERLKSILMYPVAFRSSDRWGDESVRLGESWSTGSVVLSWESVLRGGRDSRDGHNVVLHEFAHQIDQADGAADGVPELETKQDYGRWSRAFAPAFDDFCDRVNAGKKTVLDDYGATNPAEFFAVATETFFEKARALRREEPEVYRELVSFYKMDPAEW